jgi:hypothetical protein
MGIIERNIGVHSKNEYRHGLAFNRLEDICKSSKSISPSSTKSLYCFSTDSNSGANNLTFSKKEVFADDIESLALLAKLYFL